MTTNCVCSQISWVYVKGSGFKIRFRTFAVDFFVCEASKDEGEKYLQSP